MEGREAEDGGHAGAVEVLVLEVDGEKGLDLQSTETEDECETDLLFAAYI